MYGTRLTRDFGESVPEPWKQAIASLKRHEIDRGLRRLTAGGSGSPPTLPQFMKACKTIGEEEGPSRPATKPQLPAPEIDNFTRAANHWMFNYLRQRTTSRAALKDMIAEKNRLVMQYRSIDTVDRVTDKEFLDALHKAWNKVWKEQPIEEFNADRRQLLRIGYVTGNEPVIAQDYEKVRA